MGSEFDRTWKRHLAVVWTSQLIGHMGFAFALPFVPFFMQQELGVTAERLPFFVALFGAGSPLAMMLVSPLWGALADRFGRRKMLLRAYLGAAFAIGLMSLAHSPWTLFALRLVQGCFSGTMAAAMALVSTHTPEEHSGFALGALNSALFSGTVSGAFIGGLVAEYFGYRMAFVISGLLMTSSFFLVLFLVHEKFTPVPSGGGWLSSLRLPRTQLLPALPILGLMGLVMFSRHFDHSFIALLVQDLLGTISGASAWTGALSAVCGVAGVLSGFILGALADRFPPGRIAIISACITAAFMLSLALVGELWQLFLLRFGMIFASSGLDPALQIWLSKCSVPEVRGRLFGLAGSMRSLGLFLSPLAAGVAVHFWGLRALFEIGPLFFLLLALLIKMALVHVNRCQA